MKNPKFNEILFDALNKQNQMDTLEPLNKEDYITINLVLFREYTSLLKIKSTFDDENSGAPAEWKGYILDQIDELQTIQHKIHKVIVELSNQTKE